MKAKDDHLTTIGGDIIAAHLENTGYMNMADHVRHLDRAAAAANRRADLYIDKYYALLRTFQPEQPQEKRHDPTPPAEASD